MLQWRPGLIGLCATALLSLPSCDNPNTAQQQRAAHKSITPEDWKVDRFIQRTITDDAEYLVGDGLFGPTHVQIMKANIEGTALTLIYPYGGHMCGSGGCTLYIVETTDAGIRLIGKTSQVMLPIKRLSTGSSGFPDISVLVRGYGEPGSRHVIKYENGRYPSNASMEPSSNDTGIGKTVLESPH